MPRTKPPHSCATQTLPCSQKVSCEAFSYLLSKRQKPAFDTLIPAFMTQQRVFTESHLTGSGTENVIGEFTPPANFTVTGFPCCQRPEGRTWQTEWQDERLSLWLCILIIARQRRSRSCARGKPDGRYLITFPGLSFPPAAIAASGFWKQRVESPQRRFECKRLAVLPSNRKPISESLFQARTVILLKHP